MPTLPEAPGALARHVARLKHDLGKYVAMQQRWLGPEPDPEALRQALASDVLSTRRGPEGTVDAVAVWAEFRPELVGERALGDGARVDLTEDPDFAAIDAGMAELAALLPSLRGDPVAEEDVRRGHRAALAVSEGCRELARRLGNNAPTEAREDGWPRS